MTGINNGYATHLNPQDADLVDVIHTDSTWLGSFAKSGHFDFYVGEETEQEKKFGYDQPGTKECFIGSHSIAKDIFTGLLEEAFQSPVHIGPNWGVTWTYSYNR